MKILVVVYYIYFLGEFFRQYFLYSCKMLLRCRILLSSRLWYGCDISMIILPVFISKPFLYSTTVSDYCVRKSGLGFQTCYFRYRVNSKRVYLFSIPSTYLYFCRFDRIRSGLTVSKVKDSISFFWEVLSFLREF